MRAALIVIDIQNDYCSPKGKIATMGFHQDVTPVAEMLPKLDSFIKKARKLGLPVIWTQMTEAEDAVPENLQKKIQEKGDIGLAKKGTWGYQLMLPKDEKDKIVEKNSYDAFTSKSLEKILKKTHVDTLVITGVNTDVCVDSTLKSAFSKGYDIIVPMELVACPKERAAGHKANLRIWSTIFAKVMPSDEVLSYLTKN